MSGPEGTATASAESASEQQSAAQQTNSPEGIAQALAESSSEQQPAAQQMNIPEGTAQASAESSPEQQTALQQTAEQPLVAQIKQSTHASALQIAQRAVSLLQCQDVRARKISYMVLMALVKQGSYNELQEAGAAAAVVKQLKLI